MNDSEIRTVPMWVTDADWPLGKRTVHETTAVIVVNKETVQIIWSVTLVSMIKGVWIEFVKDVCWSKDVEEANTECDLSIEENWEVIEILPAMWEISCSWEEVEDTWFAAELCEEETSKEDGLNMFMSCWHCSYVIGNWGISDFVSEETWFAAEDAFLPLLNWKPGGKPWSL
jgi:hypothetical protein